MACAYDGDTGKPHGVCLVTSRPKRRTNCCTCARRSSTSRCAAASVDPALRACMRRNMSAYSCGRNYMFLQAACHRCSMARSALASSGVSGTALCRPLFVPAIAFPRGADCRMATGMVGQPSDVPSPLRSGHRWRARRAQETWRAATRTCSSFACPVPRSGPAFHGPVCHTLELNGIAVILIYRGGCVVPQMPQLIDFI